MELDVVAAIAGETVDRMAVAKGLERAAHQCQRILGHVDDPPLGGGPCQGKLLLAAVQIQTAHWWRRCCRIRSCNPGRRIIGQWEIGRSAHVDEKRRRYVAPC